MCVWCRNAVVVCITATCYYYDWYFYGLLQIPLCRSNSLLRSSRTTASAPDALFVCITVFCFLLVGCVLPVSADLDSLPNSLAACSFSPLPLPAPPSSPAPSSAPSSKYPICVWVIRQFVWGKRQLVRGREAPPLAHPSLQNIVLVCDVCRWSKVHRKQQQTKTNSNTK